MPITIRPKGKATEIAYAILGKPLNEKSLKRPYRNKQDSIKQADKIQKRLLWENTALL